MEPDETTDDLDTASVTEGDQTEADDTAVAESDEDQTDPPESEESEPGGDSEDAFDLMLEGKSVRLSKSEIEKGIMLQRDYTRKRQADADARREWDTQVAQARETLAREIEPVKGWLEFYQAHQPQEPDWDSMTPAEWVNAKRDWDKDAGKRAQAQEMYQQIKQREDVTAANRFIGEMQTAFPEWAADDALADRELAEIWVTAGTYGFSRDDIVAARNPGVFKILKDAGAWRALQAKKTDVQARVTDAPKKPPLRTVAKPSGLDEKIATAIKAAKGGNLEAAAEVMRLRHLKAK